MTLCLVLPRAVQQAIRFECSCKYKQRIFCQILKYKCFGLCWLHSGNASSRTEQYSGRATCHSFVYTSITTAQKPSTHQVALVGHCRRAMQWLRPSWRVAPSIHDLVCAPYSLLLALFSDKQHAAGCIRKLASPAATSPIHTQFPHFQS